MKRDLDPMESALHGGGRGVYCPFFGPTDDIGGRGDRPVSFRDLLSLSLNCEEQRPLLQLLPPHQVICLGPDVSLPRLAFPEIQAFRPSDAFPPPSVMNLNGGGGDMEMKGKCPYGYSNNNECGISTGGFGFRHTPDLRSLESLRSSLFPEMLPFWSSNAVPAASSVMNLYGGGVVLEEGKGPKQQNRHTPDLRSLESLWPFLFPEVLPSRSSDDVPAASSVMNHCGCGVDLELKGPKEENRFYGYNNGCAISTGDFGFGHLPDLRILGNQPPVPVNSNFGFGPPRCILQKKMTGNHQKAAYPYRPCEKSLAAKLKTKKVSRSGEVARERRRKQREKIRQLQELMPWETKMGTSKMLEEACKYVKFLQAQAAVLESMPVRGDLPSSRPQENTSSGGVRCRSRSSTAESY